MSTLCNIDCTTLVEWSTQQSIPNTTLNISTSSVFVTGKEDIKRVSFKIVTGTETTSTPNLRRDESSVDMDNYVGVLHIEPVQTMECTAEDSTTVSEYNKSAFVTGKEDIKRVAIKIVTGTETTSTPNPRRDESSVDMDNYVGVLDIEPVQTMECTAEDSTTVSEYNKSAFVTGKEDIKRVAIKIVTGTETTSTPNPRRDESSVDGDNYVA